MRRIVLICDDGVSANALVRKMNSYAQQIGYECRIEAYSLEMVKSKAAGADIILVGPQIRFAENQIREAVGPQIPLFVMEMRDYGALRADVFIEKCRKMLGDK